MKGEFDRSMICEPPRDMTPTITSFARQLCGRYPRPNKWYVDAITLAILRDEGKMIGQGLRGDKMVFIFGVEIVEFQQPD